MDDRKIDLCRYRMSQAKDSLEVAEWTFAQNLYKDSINRSYYATFYAIKTVLAVEEIDFKRHKDVMGYFNKTYVATEKISKELGRKIGKLQQIREKSDYDDFYLASKEIAKRQVDTAKQVIEEVVMFLDKLGIKL